MDTKTWDSTTCLGIWAVIVVLRAWFFFRQRENLTINRIWLFAGFSALGAMVLAIVAPIVAGARVP